MPQGTAHNQIAETPVRVQAAALHGLANARPVSVTVPTEVALTVILPVYNESGTLPETLATVKQFAEKHPEFQFLFVDDGSTDDSAALLAAAIPPAPRDAPPRRVAYISYAANRGKGHAIKSAVQLVRTDLVCFMDGDLAYGLDHLPTILGKLREHDVVIGSRKESPEERRNTRRLRRLMGSAFNMMVRVGMNLPHEDTQAGLKGFRLPAARTIFSRTQLRGFAFDVEALFIARRHGFAIVEIPARVSRSHRKKASNVNLVTEPLKMARDLLRIRWNDVMGRYR